MKNWIKFIKKCNNTDLWGFVLLDYYNKEKIKEKHDDPSKCIDDVVDEIFDNNLDPIKFHHSLLCVCVQLLGNDFEEIIKKSINCISKFDKELSKDQINNIALQYKVYGQDKYFLDRLSKSIPHYQFEEDSHKENVVAIDNRTPLKRIERNLKGKIDFAIITVRQDEFEAVINRFMLEGDYKRERIYNIAKIIDKKQNDILISIVRTHEPGQSEAQNLANDIINDLDPKWLVLVGIAGAVPDYEYTLGDVILATRVIDFSIEAAIEGKENEFSVGGGPMLKKVNNIIVNMPAYEINISGWNSIGSITINKPSVDLQDNKFYGDDDYISSVKEIIQRHQTKGRFKDDPITFAGQVATSDKLMKDTKLLKKWREHSRHVRAVEMELGGIYKAAKKVDKEYPIFAIRGISDIVGFKRNPDWTGYACNSAAAFLKYFIDSGLVY